MCGIAGFLITKRHDAVEAALGKMAMAMSHRGPDDAGVQLMPIYNDTYSLGFAHRRLAIIDLSPAGHQPMQDPETGNWIVFNGEIYNFQEIHREMSADGFALRSRTDTEVVLKAYARDGVECLSRLRGMFAFGLWDARQQRLFLARDRLGVKPLYYSHQSDRLLFASEVQALLASGLVPRRLSLAGLDSYLTLGAVQDPLTMVEEVYALPAGHYGIWKDGELTVTRYWRPPTCINEEWAQAPRPRIVSHLRELLEEAVRVRLIADVPLGAFLSGGVDSSSVVALMTRAARVPPRTVSLVFPEREFSEARYMRRVAERYETDHTEIVLTANGLLEMLPDALAAMDQPTFDGINTYIISKHTRQAGLTVALSGIGGDELFGGYKSFSWTPRLERLRQWVPGRVGPAVGAIVEGAFGDTDQARKLGRWLRNQDVEGGAYFLVRELFAPSDRRHLVPALLEARCSGQDEPVLLGSLDPSSRVSVLELTHYLRNVLLRDTDHMSMAHALEIREPFLDHRLVEFMLCLPEGVKWNGHRPKALLVEAVEGLPAEVVHRRKQGFTLPFARWLRTRLKNEVEGVLLGRGTGSVDTIFDRQAAQEVWKRFLAGKGHWVRPWALYVLHQWCGRHL